MASTNQGPRRIGQWLYLRPECIDEYKKCHAAVWPEVLEQIKDSNVRDCMYINPLSFCSTFARSLSSAHSQDLVLYNPSVHNVHWSTPPLTFLLKNSS